MIYPKRHPDRPAPWRQLLQPRRHLQDDDLYRVRAKTIEPFFAHWKAAFDLDRVPAQGTAAVSYLLLALDGDQRRIWDNHQTGRPTFA